MTMKIRPDYPNARCEAKVWVAKLRHYEQCKHSATNPTDDLCAVHGRRNGKGWNGRDVRKAQ